MSPEEQNLLSGLFERVKTANATPRDRDAETFINEAVRTQPSATYYLAQAVIVQEKGLEAAAKRIEELERQVQQLQAASQEAPHSSGGFLSSIFGSSEQPARTDAPRQAAVRPGPWDARPRDMPTAAPPSYVPAQPSQAYGANPWDRQPQQQAPAGGGFLRGAMGTAAGVAGGMLLANSLSGIFGNHMSSLGLGSALPANAPVEETIIENNYYGNDAITEASDDTPATDDGWQQADLDSSGDMDFGGDDTSDV